MNIAVVGATGMVGRKMIEVLQEQEISAQNLVLFSSSRSAGTTLTFRGKEIDVLELTPKNVRAHPCDYALFSAGGSVSKEYAPLFVETGCVVIDNSSAFRREKNVPLVVPEVNGAAALKHNGIIANPNCTTIQLVMALAPIEKAYGLKRVVVSTYQSVSGAGQSGYDDLMNAREKPQKFLYPIVHNLIPHIDCFLENGYTLEEDKVRFETAKILERPKLKVACTSVRVPIPFCHGESVNIELKENGATPEAIRALLEQAEGIAVVDNPAENRYPLVREAAGKDQTFVGRIRRDISVKNGFHLWIVADNIRKGAATNAVQILQYLIQNQ